MTPLQHTHSLAYNPSIAQEFFEAAGKPEDAPRGTRFFAENEKANRLLLQHEKMYLLLAGEVGLSVGDKPIGTVKPGEIFGEMASIAHLPRSATAVAQSDCRVIALDDRQLLQGLQHKPAFALMLMSMMIERLRDTVARLIERNQLPPDADGMPSHVFDKRMLAELRQAMGDEPPIYYDRRKTIMEEGQAALRMYVVLEGRIAVTIRGTIVEHTGPGGVLGEMALIDHSPRAATAVAETDCALLPINRNAFLALIKTRPQFGASLLAGLAERLRFLDSKIR